MEERQKPGGSAGRRKPIRAPDESVIKKSIKTEQERAADEASKYSGRPLKIGTGNHFDRKQYKRKDTGAPQPWDAAQRVTKKTKEFKESTEGLPDSEKKVPKAKSGCLGVLLLVVGSPIVLLAVFAEFWHLR